MGEALTGERDLLSWLSQVPVLSQLDRTALAGLATRVQPEAVAAGEVIVEEGTVADTLYIIVAGQVRVVSEAGGTANLLAHLGPGEIFGERALITSEPRSASVIAEVASEVIPVTRELYDEFARNAAPALSSLVARRDEPDAQQFHHQALTLTAIPVGNAEFTLGRSPECTFMIDAPGVDEVHALFRVEDGTCSIVDLNSATGTLVNRERVTEAPIEEGDIIRLGVARVFLLDGVLKVFTPERGARIDARGIRRMGGSRIILDDINVTIEPGEMVAIVGTSGAGKTTLLQTLVGLEPPTEGKVTYDGQDLYQNLPHFRRELGYVPQYDTLHLELTVHQSLHYAAKLRLTHVPNNELNVHIASVLEDLHLEDRHDTRVGSLSGGQRKRTCVAAELLSDPGTLYLDEPTSGLDPGLDLDLMRQLRELADQGRTVVLTTHATRNIRICDRVVILSAGRLVFQGAPGDALRHFGVEDFVDIYPLLTHTPAAQLADEFAAAHPVPAAIPASPAVRRAPLPSPPSALNQFGHLLGRDARVLLSDRVNTFLRVFGAPLLAFLLTMVFRGDIFAVQRLNGGNAEQVVALLYLSAAICLFLGGFASANVITRERNIFEREHLVSLSPAAYVLSKVCVLSLFSLFQGLVFIAVLETRINIPGGLETALQLGLTLALVSLGGMAMGLFISAISSNADRAAILVVMAIIPQLIFAGSTVPRVDMDPVSKVISDVTITKWSLELTGHITDLTTNLAAQSTLTAPAPGGGTTTVRIPYRPFEKAFAIDAASRWAVLAGMFVLYVVLTLAAQYRKR
jgi:ABC-type multidrug transport system ATPase subunit